MQNIYLLTETDIEGRLNRKAFSSPERAIYSIITNGWENIVKFHINKDGSESNEDLFDDRPAQLARTLKKDWNITGKLKFSGNQFVIRRIVLNPHQEKMWGK